MIEVGAVISGHTTHGSFVSPGLSSPANLSTLLPLGPALIATIAYLTFSQIFYFEMFCVVFVLMEDDIPE